MFLWSPRELCYTISMKKKMYRGFTLVELMIVMAIIGLLGSLTMVATAGTRISSRDIRRVSDVQQVVTALEFYYNRADTYPTIITSLMPLTDGSRTYLESVPENTFPRQDGDCLDRNFLYEALPGSATYQVTFCLGSDKNRLKKGINVCENGSCLPCDELRVNDGDGNVYGAVSIGGQCWLAENLRAKSFPDGSCINGGTPPCADASAADNSKGRSCYDNLESNCVSDGALYDPNVILNGGSEGARGICPFGWHIPQDSELAILDSYLNDFPNVCNPLRNGWGCNGAGSKLKPGGASGFNMVYAGQRGNDDGFSFRGSNASIWSSTAGDLPNSYWYRYVFSGTNGIARGRTVADFSLSLRCLKNY